MATPRKSPAKKPVRKAAAKAPAKAAAKALPKIKPSRFAAFDSAAAEWDGEPVGFLLDGKTWLCVGEPTSKVIKYLRNPGAVAVSDFIAECVIDRDGWETYLEANAVPGKLMSGIATFLMKVYLGLDPGK